MEKKQYTTPLCKMVSLTTRCMDNQFSDDETGLIDVGIANSPGVDPSMAESNQATFTEEDTPKSVWDN